MLELKFGNKDWKFKKADFLFFAGMNGQHSASDGHQRAL
jgi:hypothetical protein